jgi:hypothetical protein
LGDSFNFDDANYAQSTVRAVRRHTDGGFWVAMAPPNSNWDGAELWYVDLDGTITLEGVYPSAPTGIKSPQQWISEELDGHGQLFSLASRNGHSVVLRRNAETSTAEIVFDSDQTGLDPVELVTGW